MSDFRLGHDFPLLEKDRFHSFRFLECSKLSRTTLFHNLCLGLIQIKKRRIGTFTLALKANCKFSSASRNFIFYSYFITIKPSPTVKARALQAGPYTVWCKWGDELPNLKKPS